MSPRQWAARMPSGSPARKRAQRASILVLSLAVTALAGCSFGPGTLGGRQKCWPEGDRRVASLWRGTLRIDASGGRLETPEGEVIPLLPGTLQATVGPSGEGTLVRGDEVVARAGADVTLFGGAGADGSLVVCAVEEVHSTP